MNLLMPNTINNAVKILINNPCKKICFGDWLSIDEEDNIIDKHLAFDFNLNHFKYEAHLNSQSLFLEKNVHKNFSGFDTKLNKTMD